MICDWNAIQNEQNIPSKINDKRLQNQQFHDPDATEFDNPKKKKKQKMGSKAHYA